MNTCNTDIPPIATYCECAPAPMQLKKVIRIPNTDMVHIMRDFRRGSIHIISTPYGNSLWSEALDAINANFERSAKEYEILILETRHLRDAIKISDGIVSEVYEGVVSVKYQTSFEIAKQIKATADAILRAFITTKLIPIFGPGRKACQRITGRITRRATYSRYRPRPPPGETSNRVTIF